MDFYVSTTGSDAAHGTADAPFETLVRAREAIRERVRAGSDGGVDATNVWIESGVYPLQSPLQLDVRDSGWPGAPVTWRALPGASVELTGFVSIPGLDFERVRDRRALRRLRSPAARDRIRKLDLRNAGLGDWGERMRRGYAIDVPLPPMEPYFDGKRLAVSRWPRGRSLPVTFIFEDGSRRRRLRRSRHKVSFSCGEPLPHAWLREKDLWINGVLSDDWIWSANRVARLRPRAGRVTLAYTEMGPAKRTGHNFFQFENLFSELQEPGEYYVDHEDESLYLIPPEGFDRADAELRIARMSDPLIVLNGASHVALQDILLTGGRDVAVSCSGGEACRIVSCEISQFGRGGIRIDGASHVVDSCHIHDVGAEGVLVGRHEKEAALPTEGVRVHNCHIHHWGHWQKVYAPAVQLSGRCHTIERCLIHDGPHVGIVLSGNDHSIDANEIHDVVMEFRDMGAVYMDLGQTPWQRGFCIRRNYLRDIGQARDHVAGIYLDNATMGVRVEENVFVNFGSAANRDVPAIKANGTAHVSVERNLFLDCAKTFELNFFLAEWGRQFLHRFEAAWSEAGARLRDDDLLSRYPELAAFEREDRVFPASNRFADNVVFNDRIERAHAGAFLVQFGPEALLETERNREAADRQDVFTEEHGVFRLPGGPVGDAVELCLRDVGLVGPVGPHTIIPGCS